MQEIWYELIEQQKRTESQKLKTHPLDIPMIDTEFISGEKSHQQDMEQEKARFSNLLFSEMIINAPLVPGESTLDGMDLDVLHAPAAFELAHYLGIIFSGLTNGRTELDDSTSGHSRYENPLLGRGVERSSTARKGLHLLEVSHCVTAWRILVLALKMREPTSRQLTLALLTSVMQYFSKTCQDSATREALAHALIHVARTDEYDSNRLHALHTLGELSFYLISREGVTDDSHDLSSTPVRIFWFLVDQLYAIHIRERDLLIAEHPSLTPSIVLLKMYLFNALGKFLKSEVETQWCRNVILYLCWAELEHVSFFFKSEQNYLGVMEVLLSVLTTVGNLQSL
jgi:uncharacterized membrane protein